MAEIEDKGILGAAYTDSYYQSLFIKAGASNAVGPLLDNGEGFKSRQITISPATLGKGSQVILRFAGHFPEQTLGFVMNPTLWGDHMQVTNLPSTSLGQVMYDALGQVVGGQATITIDFELIEE